MVTRASAGLIYFLETRLMPGMEHVSNVPLLVAVRSGLAVTMPLVLLGSLAVLLNSFPLPAYRVFMESVFGPDWRFFGGVIWSSTFAVMSLTMQFSVGTQIAQHYNDENPRNMVSPLIAGLVSFATLLSLIAMESGGLSPRWMGVSGLFVALIVAVTSVKLFLFLYSFPRLRLYLPGGTPDFALPDMFNSLVPAILTVTIFAGGGLIIHALSGTTIHEAFHTLLRRPFDIMGDGFSRGMFYIFSLQSLWFFGIHGANVLDPITHDIYGAAMAANEAAALAGQALPHIMTKPFMDVFVFMGGAGTSISLAFALLLFGETKNQRRLAGISLIPGLFNLNEILLFGLPVILNPVMLVPFVFIPLVLAFISYCAVAWGLVPGTSANVEWTTPVFLNAYLSTGSLSGAVLQLVNLTVGTCLYAPFVLISNRINSRRVDRAFTSLLSRVTTTETQRPNALERGDETGLLARALVPDLEHAFYKEKSIYLEFQPQIAATTGRVSGVEALLRWKHPYYGLIPAPITIALAEGTGLIKPMGLWIFEEACTVREQWLNAGMEDIVLAINVSALQLEENLVKEVVGIMQRHRIPSDILELEVTESTMLGAGTAQSQYLSQLHMLGLRIAIDDFGMGHSSLKYLKQFPVTTVKIDDGISREVVTNPICADIVASITRLCRARGMLCVAEFVENDAQAAVLRTLGVDALQGHIFSPSLAADECFAFIRENNARAAKQENRVRIA
ncbi:PTS system protein [uncultured delta proteobacterium]|uniref:PTS system protein n=1 Tax=uncultured delta proteobacterium TaxID=34034 RepID=A0A212KCJ9_9DELT|nr:PTS system protein [uncultured delta proteobacterium]